MIADMKYALVKLANPMALIGTALAAASTVGDYRSRLAKNTATTLGSTVEGFKKTSQLPTFTEKFTNNNFY